MVPAWLHLLSIAALLLSLICSLAIAIDVTRHHQHMFIMNIVWPVTALFGGLLALWGYFKYGRLATHEAMKAAMERNEPPPSKMMTPFWAIVGKGTTHCGSGCAIGDICAEWLVFAFPGIAVAFGWQSVFTEKMFAVWVLDFVLAFLIAPVLAIIPLSFNAGSYFSYPMTGFSLRWYEKALLNPDWQRAFLNSLGIGAMATLIATVLGTLAALGLSRSSFPWRSVIMPLLISPMIIPVVVVAVGFYMVFAPLGLTDSYAGVVLAQYFRRSLRAGMRAWYPAQ